MTASPPLPPHTSVEASLTPSQLAELMAALPRLGLLADLLARLLARLDSPGGEVDQRLEAALSDLAAIATGLDRSARAMEAMAGEGGLFGIMATRLERLEVALTATREEMAAQAQTREARDAATTQRLEQAIAWLGGPIEESLPDPGQNG